MVNSKKSTKSIVALVVMAFLLIASIALAATGAWFTDSATGTDNGVWGEVSLASDSITVTVNDLALPGDKIVENAKIAYTGDVDAWYKVEVQATGITAPATVYGEAKVGDEISIADITIPSDLTYETVNAGDAVSVTVTVTVIQKTAGATAQAAFGA